jgi:hypothetical protein
MTNIKVKQRNNIINSNETNSNDRIVMYDYSNLLYSNSIDDLNYNATTKYASVYRSVYVDQHY